MTARYDYVDCTFMLSPCLNRIPCDKCKWDSLCGMYADVMDLDIALESTMWYTEGETVYENYQAW